MQQKYRLVINDMTLEAVRKLRDAIYESGLLSEHEENNLGFVKMPENEDN